MVPNGFHDCSVLMFPCFHMQPDGIDLWSIRKLAGLLGRWRLLDLGIQSAIVHGLLGGYWFSAVIFLLWVPGMTSPQKNTRARLLTIMIGSAFAILFGTILGRLVCWTPPNRNPSLAHFYPSYLLANPNQSSFPSMSTSVYSSVAAGVFSLYRWLGVSLWILVIVAIAVPRMYVGGHYPADVLVGIVLGISGYWVARKAEPCLSGRMHLWLEGNRWMRITTEIVVFLWIVQMAVEFRELVWARNIMDYFLRHGRVL